MFDFVNIVVRDINDKKEKFEVYPEFIVKKSKDLMIRGKDFYAAWDEENELWTTDENYISTIIDAAVKKEVEIQKEKHPDAKSVHGKYLRNFSSNKWTEWQKYVRSLPDNYHELDTRIIFADENVKKTDYISKRLDYSLSDGPCDAYDEIMSTLYEPDERKKLEWSVGAIISGDSKHIQKFIVLKGAPGTGKSTFLNIVQKLFPGYYKSFSAKALGSNNDSFALEAFKDNPLIAIQHDGDLSRIEDNTRLNQIISHEMMTVNEKFKSAYTASFNSFLYMGTNKPVKITDAKSGIIRRLISVEPSGETLSYRKYQTLMGQIDFELGAIAKHCLDVYREMGENYYDKYVALDMIGATNDFFNFVEEMHHEFVEDDKTNLRYAWSKYKDYVEEARVSYPYPMRQFKEELKNYFREFHERSGNEYSVYEGFLSEKFVYNSNEEKDLSPYKLQFNKRTSMFDEWCKDKGFKAQYANEDGNPKLPWDKVTTTLEDIDTKELHWVLIPEKEHHIRIDFDLKDENGEKSLELNMEAANNWPATYAELSKSGGGIHLHYFYDGDINKLKSEFAPGIEIKVSKGHSAVRRKLTKCNDVPMATINSGLPLKEEKKMITENEIKDDQHLRNKIIYALKKKGDIVSTAVGINYIYDTLKQAYESGMHYDVSDMSKDVYTFASNSSNQAQECLKKFTKMHFRSKDFEEGDYTAWQVSQVNPEDKPIIFLDVEVFPNVFIVCWKYQGEGKSVTRLINPSSEIVRNLYLNYRIIGFNNTQYDNAMLYCWGEGYTNYGLFKLSQDIIVNNNKKAIPYRSRGISYTDVYDFSNTKQGLKQWEIDLGIFHLENQYAWDEDLPEDKWDEVADYCANDVIATEKVFDHLHEDWMARQILALLSGLTVNDTTNNHTARIIFGDVKEPWHDFEYTDLSEMFPGYRYDVNGIDPSEYDDPDNIVAGKSVYRGEDPGEGGYVYAEPGMYSDVALLDIASMHPNSALNMNIFGPYTERYRALVNARLAIKHKDYEEALKQLLIINPNVEKELRGYLSEGGNVKALAYALKIPINAVYGMTSAPFQNKFKDPRNIDNIVAKRGALFMINLKHEVQERGFTVAHIKTDSIKIPNATPEIIDFVMNYGKEYGYTFEHEATYDRMCLVNDAVYIAKYKDSDEWTATGKEFQVPYVFKTLFSHEPIEFHDLCQTINVKQGELYLEYAEDNMKFVGRVGSFVPVKAELGGHPLWRVKDGKKFAPPGTKDYLWLESEYVKKMHKEDDINMEYYENMANKAIDHINEFGNFDRFINDPNYDPQFEKILNVPEGINDEIPWDEDTFMNKPA
jgi:phage/plasmid-associated DNA primase